MYLTSTRRTFLRRKKRETEVSKYIKISWEPSAAEDTKVAPAVYPHLNDFTGKLNFRPIQLGISKPSYRNIPVGLPSSPIKI